MPTVQLPNGQTASFPDGMAAADIQKAIESDPNSGATPPTTMLQKFGQGAEDLGKGVLKGAGSTANTIGSMLIPDRLVKAFGVTPPTAEESAAPFKPTNTMQSIGKGVEQAGEFIIPGGAEERAVGKVAEFAPKLKPLAKVLASAVSSGVVNKAQGGDFSTGAAAGGVGSVIGAGVQKLAPGIAEGALKIRKLDRAYDRTPGLAALEETKGIRPGTVAKSAQDVLGKINPELENIMGTRSIAPVDLSVPRGIVKTAQDSAVTKNAASSFGQLEPMAKQLSENFSTGAQIPQTIAPIDGLNLKRGFGDEFVHNWNPETMQGTKGTAAKTYRAIADEIHTSVPGSKELDNRASSLIPVAKRGASTALNADTSQRVLGRFGTHTGALALGAAGATGGYQEGGIPGAIKYGALGVLAPELIASPTGQMAIARTLHSGAKPIAKALVGGALQANRK